PHCLERDPLTAGQSSIGEAGTPANAEPPTNSGSEPARLELYQARLTRYIQAATELGNRSRLVSNFRGLCFGVLVVSAIGWMTSDAGIWVGLTIAAAAGFAVLVVLHSKVIEREDAALRWVQVNRDAVKRCSG